MGRTKRGAMVAGPVRVTRNGNARTLTVPAELAATAGIEPGDEFTVEVVDGALIYRPVEPARPEPGGPRGYFVGEGCQRYFQLYRGMAMPAGPDPAPRALDDWDF